MGSSVLFVAKEVIILYKGVISSNFFCCRFSGFGSVVNSQPDCWQEVAAEHIWLPRVTGTLDCSTRVGER